VRVFSRTEIIIMPFLHLWKICFQSAQRNYHHGISTLMENLLAGGATKPGLLQPKDPNRRVLQLAGDKPNRRPLETHPNLFRMAISSGNQ
jgi:hypothetical protein